MVSRAYNVLRLPIENGKDRQKNGRILQGIIQKMVISHLQNIEKNINKNCFVGNEKYFNILVFELK